MKIGKKIAILLIRAKLKMLSVISARKAAATAFDLFCTPFPPSKKQLAAIFASAETLTIIYKDNAVHGYGWNHKSGRNILLLHGFSSAAGNFGHFVQPLLDKGYGVLAFDAPAHGRSGGKMINAVDYADVVTIVAEQFGPIYGAVAHSFGGLALCLATEKGICPPVEKIVLIAPATETTSAIDNAFGMLNIGSKRVRSEFERIIVRMSGQGSAWFSIRRAIAGITAQVLWVQDENDEVTPTADAVRVERDGHRHVHFIYTTGLGHHKIYRDGDVVRVVIAFL